MTKEELAAYRRSLSMLSTDGVQRHFREAYEKCRMVDDRLPRARAIQELVVAWKLLWKWGNR